MYVDVTLACAVGGTGNILDNFGVHDIGDVAVLAIESWKWIGHYRLSGDIIPGRHHTACRGIGNQLLVMGGGRRPSDKAQIITEFTDVWPLFVDILLILGSCLLLGGSSNTFSFVQEISNATSSFPFLDGSCAISRCSFSHRNRFV